MIPCPLPIIIHYHYPSTNTCTDVGGANTMVISQVPSGTACQTSSCTPYSGGGGSYSATCSGSTLSPVGTVTTGYAIMSISFASTDTTCKVPLQAVIYPVGVCIATYGSSTSSAASGGMKLTADAPTATAPYGILYISMYSSVTCTGTYLTSYQLPTSQQTCTYNAATVTDPASYSQGYFYSPIIPTPPASTGSYATAMVYSGATCTGTPTAIVLLQTTA